MIGLDDYDNEQQSTSELPEKPLKEWRRKFESGSLVSQNLMQYFQAASPFFFTIDQTAEYSDLGKRFFNQIVKCVYFNGNRNHKIKITRIRATHKRVKSYCTMWEKATKKKMAWKIWKTFRRKWFSCMKPKISEWNILSYAISGGRLRVCFIFIYPNMIFWNWAKTS